MDFPDISEWYTPERIAAEELQWEKGGTHKLYSLKILEVCRSYNLSTVAEVGCGTGWVPTVLDPSLDYIGIDKNFHMVYRSMMKNPGKTFFQCDIRNVKTLGIFSDLVCSFAVLKHFSLEEWPLRLRNLLSLGRFGLFTQQVFLDGRAPMDIPEGFHGTGPNGYHSIWCSRDQVLQAIKNAGHELLELDEKSLFNHGVGGPESMIVTRRKL